MSNTKLIKRTSEEEVQFLKDTEELINWIVTSTELGIHTGIHRYYATPMEYLLQITEQMAITQGMSGNAAKFKRELDDLDKTKLH